MSNFTDISLDDFDLDSKFSDEEENFINVDGGTSVACSIVYSIIGISNATTTGTGGGPNYSEYNC